MTLDTTIQALKAVGDPTRVRLVALLAAGEATVGELQRILDQSQPRVSRHLKLLDEAGIVTKFRDGQWTYYSLAATDHARDLVDSVIRITGRDDATLVADADELARVKRERERDAFTSDSRVAFPANAFTGARPGSEQIAAAVDDALGDGALGDVLDVGSGAGNLLRVLGKRARTVVGVDRSKRMRLLSRSRAHRSGIANCSVRNGELRALPFGDRSFDVVVLDEVLSGERDAFGGLREALRVLRDDGRLIIVDRIRPVQRQLARVDLPEPADHALIENQLATQLSELGCRIARRHWLPGRVMEYALLVVETQAEQQRTGTDV